MKRTLSWLAVSSTSLLHQSQTLVCVTGAFRMLLSQLCFCPPPVSQHTLNTFLGVSSWLEEDRGVCSLSHLHPLQALVFTEHCLEIAPRSQGGTGVGVSWAGPGVGFVILVSPFHFRTFYGSMKSFLACPTARCPLSPSHLTGNPSFWGGDKSVKCRDSCSLRVCSVALLAARKFLC